MTKTRIMKKRITIVLSLIAVLVMGNAAYAFAVDNGSMPDLKSDTSRLTVLTQYTDEDVTKPISGMELTIYKVADLTVVDGVAKYSPTKEFESIPIDYDKMTTSESIDAAEKLAKLVEGGKIEGKTAASNSEGKANFGSVTNGMYMVVQTGATGDAKEYTRLRPYILMAPQPMAYEDRNEWEYEVSSVPKMEVVNRIINITKKVNNGTEAVIQNPSNKFTYDIVTGLDYVPDDNFAVVDNIPDELELVDLGRIEIIVNGEKLDKETKESILKIEGNKLKVEPTMELIKAWTPFEMKVIFYCRFREDLVFTEVNDEVENVAGYEVDDKYIEPEGDKNRAVVRAEFNNPTTTTLDSKVDSARTGDETNLYLWALLAMMSLSAIIVLVVVRRRRTNN